jgi:predicted acetyltransferase
MPAPAVVPATPEQEGLVGRSLSAYLAELGVPSAYPYLPLYWREPERFPYVIVAGSEIVGFALVRKIEAAAQFEMAEFYVVPTHRRIGIGRRAACQLFAMHRGSWRVSPISNNVRAQAFWVSVLASASSAHNPSTDHVANRSIERRPSSQLRFACARRSCQTLGLMKIVVGFFVFSLIVGIVSLFITVPRLRLFENALAFA